jgi:hypothetical protein
MNGSHEILFYTTDVTLQPLFIHLLKMFDISCKAEHWPVNAS